MMPITKEIIRKDGNVKVNIFIVLLLLLFFVSGCGVTQTMSKTESTSTGQPTSEESADDISDLILGVWNIQYAKNASDGTDYPLQDYYGTGIQYGGKLTLNEDGTFSKYIGITSNETSIFEGNYYLNNNEIIFIFGSGRRERALYIPSSQEIEYHMQSIDGTFFNEYFSKS